MRWTGEILRGQAVPCVTSSFGAESASWAAGVDIQRRRRRGISPALLLVSCPENGSVGTAQMPLFHTRRLAQPLGSRQVCSDKDCLSIRILCRCTEQLARKLWLRRYIENARGDGRAFWSCRSQDGRADGGP